MGKIFFDFNGDFQWASVAAIVAGFGALASLIFSFLSYRNTQKSILIQKEMDQKKIDASIIGDARIKWIQEVRKIVAELDYSIEELKIAALQWPYVDSQEKSEYRKLARNCVVSIDQLYLLIGPDSDEKDDRINSGKNNEIIKYIENIREGVLFLSESLDVIRTFEKNEEKGELKDYYKGFDDISLKVKESKDDLVIILRKYLKQEWKEITKEKK